jgi:PAS domain S-box-containing protein
MSNLHFIEKQSQLKKTQRTEQLSAESLRGLLENSNSRIWEVDDRLRYVYASPGCRDMLGYHPEDLLDKSPFDFMPVEEALRMRTVFQDLLLQQRPFQGVETVYVGKDGSLRVLEASGVPVFDVKGRFTGLRGIDHDITGRSRAEQALQAALNRSTQEQARLDAIIAAIGEGLILVDPEFRILYQNRHLMDLAGNPMEDHCYVRYGDRENVCDNCPVALTFLDGAIHSTEKALQKDGVTVYREITASPLRDESGRIIAGIEVIRDITERKRAEHALKESEWQMKEVQRIANLGSWQLDYGTGVLIWSDETYRILGLQPHQTPSTYQAFLEIVHPGDLKQVMSSYSESVRNGSAGYEIEHRIVRQPGAEIRYVHQKCEHVRDAGGKVIRSYGMIHDVTSRKLAEEHISTLNADLSARAAELETVNKDLEAFSYTVSHDLRGPLTNINSYCQAIAELGGDRLDEQCTGFLDSVFLEVKSMDQLITSLLNLSRFTHIKLKKRRIDLSEMARTIAAELQIREPERRVTFEIGEGITASGDERLLRMVLVNLFGNAWKFSAQREQPVIRFGMERLQGRPVYFVSDNGIGFEMNDRDKIFAVFQRLHRSEDFEGFGIGLTTVKRIIERHDGRIWAEGEPGNGAKFLFTLHEKPAER